MAFFVAFYSYKGGVGRTLALANTAYSLAARGKRVVMIDMDLEAPALHDFPEFKLPDEQDTLRGFLEYAAAYSRDGECPAIEEHAHAVESSPGSGKLWLMPAGHVGGSYQQTLGELSWRRLHVTRGTEPFVQTLRDVLVEKFRPHYVLIDARTGLSDIGGLSTHLLAEMVVVVFNLTRRCIEGSVRAYRSFTSEGTRVKTVHLVASPVPPFAPDGQSLIDKRLEQVADLMPLGVNFGRKVSRIEYDPTMVLAEELAVRRVDNFPQAARRYETLRETIQRANPEEVFPLVEEAEKLRSSGRLKEAITLLGQFAEDHPDNAEGFLELGNLLLESGDSERASDAFRNACKLAPELALLHRRLGEALLATGRSAEARIALEKAERLGEQSIALFEAQAAAYAEEGNALRQTEARRNAIIELLGASGSTPTPSASDFERLQSEFVELAQQDLPYFSFRPAEFWRLLMGSLTFSTEIKTHIARSILGGRLTISQILAIEKALEEEWRYWPDMLGPSANELQVFVAGRLIDPRDSLSWETLLQGNSTDSALFLLRLIEEQDPNKQIDLLKKAFESDPSNESVADALAHFVELMARDRERISESTLEEFRDFSRKMVAEKPTPTSHRAAGLATALKATEGKTENREKELKQAVTHFEAAFRDDPQNLSALGNLGRCLAALAEEAPRNKAKKLFRSAIKKYQQILESEPDHHFALDAWGNALLGIAKLESGANAKELLKDSIEKFRRASEIQPDSHNTLNSWAAATLHLANSESAYEEMAQLLEKAVDRCGQANRIVPNTADYNLACALTSLGRPEEAAGILAAKLVHRPQDRTLALDDSDFEELWAEYPKLREAVRESIEQDSPEPLEEWLDTRER